MLKKLTILLCFILNSTFLILNSFAQNVGVDVATPLQKLDVAGGIRIGNTTTGLAGSIRWTGTAFEGHDGSVWAPFGGANTAWKLTGNSGTNPATNFIGTFDNLDLNLRTNNTNRITITAGGSVGIATTSPANRLDVSGSVGMSSLNPFNAQVGTNAIQMQAGGSTDKWINFRQGGSPTGRAGVIFSNFSASHYFVNNHNGNLNFWYSTENTDNPSIDNSASQMSLLGTNGYLGLGIMVPTSALHISKNDAVLTLHDANDNTIVALVAPGASSTGGVGTTSNHDFPIFTNNNDRITIKAGGNVGIGTNSPLQKLQVKGGNALFVGSSGTTEGIEIMPRNSNSNAGGRIYFREDNNDLFGISMGYNGGNTGNEILNWPANTFNITTHSNDATGAIALTILRTNGNVGINTTNPTQKLDVAGKIQMQTGAAVGYVPVSDANGTMTWTNPTSLTITETDPQVSSTTTNYIPKWNGTALVDGVAYDNGTNVGIGTTAPDRPLTVQGTGVNNELISLKNSAGTTKYHWNLSGGGLNLAETGVADGRIYVKDATGNVGIGTTTTPAKLSVLGVSSNPTIPGSTSTAVFRVGVNPDEGIDFGKAGAPSYAGWIQSGYQGTSMDPLALQPVGGNVGIGTTTPAQKLDVNGKIQMRTGATAGYVPVSDANGTMTWTNPTSLTITETDPQVSSTTTNYIPKWNGTALVDGLAYDNGTNIGIGTTTPLELLELSKSGADNYIRVNAGSSNANSSGIKLNEGGFNFGWNMRFNANDDDLYFEHNNSGTITNLMKLDNGGNIGIGTTAPGAYLDITGTNAGTTSLQLRSGNTSVATSSNQITLGYSGTENYRHAVKTRHSSGGAAGNSIDFYVWKHGTDAAGTIGTQQVMTVDGGNGGSVGIGTTAPAQALDVNGKIQMRTGATAGYVPVSDANGTMTWTNPTSLSITETDPQVSSTTTNYVPKWSGTSLVDGVVFDNGSNVGIGNSAPNTLLHLHNASNVGPQITLSAPSGGTPGIVFRPYQTPAQWSNPAQALISATDNNYSADIHFQTKTPGALANALVERMTIQNDGHVGIGSTSPTQALLVVSGSVNTSLTAEYFNNSGGTGNTTASRPLSAYFSSHIACSELQVFSDERIKNIKGISDTKEDLNTLMNIKITDYTFKDSIGKGTQQIKKVIAQQVEKVYPQAVSTLTDIVPDIYKIASIKDGRIFVENNLKAGEKVKLIFENRTELVEVLEADANGFNVNLSDEGKVFVFGREVSDFHTVDYEAISMLNVSATQELSKQLKAAQAEIEALKNANSLLQTESNTKINTMQTQIDMITEHLNMKSEK